MTNQFIQKLFNLMNKQIFLRGSQLQIQKNLISVKKSDKIVHKPKKQDKNSFFQKFTLFQSNESKQKKLNQLQLSPHSRVRSNLLSKSCQEHKLLYQVIEQHKRLQKTLFVKQKQGQGEKYQNLSYLPVVQVKINSSISQIAPKSPNAYNFYSKKNPNLNKCMIKCNRKKIQSRQKKKTISELEYSLLESESNRYLQQNKNLLINLTNKDHSECKINFFNKQNTKKRYYQQKLSLDFQLVKNGQQNRMLKKSATTPVSYLASDQLISRQSIINEPKHLQVMTQNDEIQNSISIKKQIRKLQYELSKHLYPKIFEKNQYIKSNLTNDYTANHLKHIAKSKINKRNEGRLGPKQKIEKPKLNQTFFRVEAWQNNHTMDEQQYIPQDIQEQIDQSQK